LFLHQLLLRIFQRLSTANNTFPQEQIQNLITLANRISNLNLTFTVNANVAYTSGTSFSCYTVSLSQNQFTWILDIGTIDHMICCLSLFCSIVFPKTPFNVHLPNGQTVPIVFTGTIKFSLDIVLHNALYVLSFNVNLVFVLRLTTDNFIGLFFLQSKCILQDLSKWRMIRLAKVQSGLYHLHKPFAQPNTEMLSSSIGLPSSSLVESCIVASNLWHFCLGYIPTTKINLLSSYDSSITVTRNSVCEICPLAKQKLAFPLSTNKSN